MDEYSLASFGMVADPLGNYDCAPTVTAGVGFFHLWPGHYPTQKQDSTTHFKLGASQMPLGCRSGAKSLGEVRKIALAWWSPKIFVSNQRDTRVTHSCTLACSTLSSLCLLYSVDSHTAAQVDLNCLHVTCISRLDCQKI